MNYWYAALADEMFLDLDSRRAFRRAVSVLLVAIREKRLPVKKVYVYPTRQAGHYHMIVVLRRPVPHGTLWAWLLWMGNDRLRMSYVIRRYYDERVPLSYGDLLVSKREYYRLSDAVCSCRGKHKKDSVTRRCPAMRLLLGKARSADYFARTGERRVRPLRVRVPWGEVSMSKLKQWIRKR